MSIRIPSRTRPGFGAVAVLVLSSIYPEINATGG
jgi:hypothetical protein